MYVKNIIKTIKLYPLTFHFYALCIILGVVAAVYIGNRRFVAAGGSRGVVSDVAVIAVPAGIIGGRLYHVITSPQQYFGANGNWIEVFYIWQGGLGIWGATQRLCGIAPSSPGAWGSGGA